METTFAARPKHQRRRTTAADSDISSRRSANPKMHRSGIPLFLQASQPAAVPSISRQAETTPAPEDTNGQLNFTSETPSPFGSPAEEFGLGTFAQAQLSVGKPNDSYEREADNVADQVIAGNRPETISRISTSGLPGATQRTTKAGDTDQDRLTESKTDEFAMEDLADSDQPSLEPQFTPAVSQMPLPVSRTPLPSGTDGGGNQASLASRIKSPASGRQMSAPVRKDMESAFGADFSSVRIHDTPGDRADAADLGARAFTHKSGIWLGPGSSENDRHLMAHELTHVLQQDSAVRRQSADEDELEATDLESLTPEMPVGYESGAAADRGGEEVGPVNSDFVTSDQPEIQALAWYNFSIPGTDYYFDPSIEGVKNAAGIAKDTAVDAGGWVKDQVVSGFEWVYEKIASLVNAGIDWLDAKFTKIKEFATSSFDTIRDKMKSMLHQVTSPFSLITAALALLNADSLGAAWKAIKTGAAAVWLGMKNVINGVMDVGLGLWKTVSRYVGGLFDQISSVIDSWPFRQLPNFLQRKARNLFKTLRNLWYTIRDYITDLLRRLKEFAQDVLDSIEWFYDRVVEFSIETVVNAVNKIRGLWDLVTEVASDPIGYIQPWVDRIAAKLDAEVPPKAQQEGRDRLRENFAQERTADGSYVVVQKTPDKKPKRSTAGFFEAIDGFCGAITDAWAKLDIGDILLKMLINTIWPPATIRAIGHEFYELWTNDWSSAVNSLYAPRTDSFFGLLHDVWSNFLILLDFLLALIRRLTAVAMLLVGMLTFLATIIGALVGGVVGAIEGGGAGFFPGTIAGAKFVLGVMAPLGFVLLKFFLGVEGVSILKSAIDLFTARQTQKDKDRDYVQIAGSLIGIAMALLFVAVFSLFSTMIRGIVRGIKGFRGKPQPEPPVEEAKPRPTEISGERYQVKDPAEIKSTEPVTTYTVIQKGGVTVKIPTLHWELYVKLPNGKKAVFCEVNIRKGVSRGSPELNLDPSKARVEGSSETIKLEFEKIPKEGGGESSKYGWTTESLRAAIDKFQQTTGKPPENLGGWLAKRNLENFQVEFANAQRANPQMSNSELGAIAVRNISYGKHRIPLGYKYFEVTIAAFKDGKPTIVRVDAWKNPRPKFRPVTHPPDVPDDDNDNADVQELADKFELEPTYAGD